MLLCCEGDGLEQELWKFSLQDLPKGEHSFSCLAQRINGSCFVSGTTLLPTPKIVKSLTLKAAEGTNICRELTLIRQKAAQLCNVLLYRKKKKKRISLPRQRKRIT